MSCKWDDAKPLTPGDAKPLCRRVRDIILAKIDAGILQPGDMLPTEMELARIFNVSRSTIRHALGPLARDGVLLSTRGRGTVVQQRRAVKSCKIGLLCPFLAWYALDLIDGIQSAIHPHGYDLVIRNTQLDARLEARLITELLQQDVSGIILWPCKDYDQEASASVQSLLSGERPFVSIDVRAEKRSSVTTHNFGGGYLIGKHLLEHGYERIGFVGKSLRSTESERLAGLREAVSDTGRELDPSLVFRCWPDKAAFREWVELARPRALCCVNDGTAIEVMTCLAQAGLKVPDNIAVAGYDDNKALASMASPALTSVRQDFAAIGRAAGREIIECIKSPRKAASNIMLPVQLTIRGSCGCS